MIVDGREWFMVVVVVVVVGIVLWPQIDAMRHHHRWAKWEATGRYSTLVQPTVVIQERRCETCGAGERRTY